MEWIYPPFEEVSFTGCTETRKVVNMTPHGADIDDNFTKMTAFTFPITFIFRK